MKILIVGDLHFRKVLPYASAFEDGRRGEWEAVKKTIHEAAEGCKMVVLMGDNLNNKHNHSSVLKEFVEFLKGFIWFRDGMVAWYSPEIHTICGNHEQYGEGTALDFLKGVNNENWHIHTEPEIVRIGSRSFAFSPYLPKGSTALKDILKDKKIDVLFAHNAYATSMSMMLKDSEYLLGQETIDCRHVVYGHIHSEEEGTTTLGTGSVFTAQVGEHKKAIWKYDTDTEKVERIPLPVRGIYKTEWDGDDVLDAIPNHSIVKCYIKHRGTDLGDVKLMLSRFDASMIVEDYPDERKKVHFDGGALDLSTESLLKTYSEVKGVDLTELMDGYSLIK